MGVVEAADVLGASGVYRDPLWRLRIELTDLERALLRCWPVRRLAFVAHAGAAGVCTTQTYSRLEHSLGVLALTSHFAPQDLAARAAALLHDVGHLPLSHSFEGVAGLDHHTIGREIIVGLGDLLARHGVRADDVIAIDRGDRPSVLHSATRALKLDHLDSFVRSGRAHGRTEQPPAQTLSRIDVVDGAVSTDADAAAYLARLIAGEARLHLAAANVVPNAVIRHLARMLLERATPAQRVRIARMTDDEFWAAVLADPATAEYAWTLRRDPATWRIAPAGTSVPGAIEFTITKLYLDLPLIRNEPMHLESDAFAGLPAMPWTCSVVPVAS